MPRFIIFASYGNDSCALIQWARENELQDVACVYSDTGWSTADWRERVERMEAWTREIGFTPYRTQSIGFAELARKKSGFPTQRFQWCSFILKIEPAQKWLEENDPNKSAICLVGIRREESQARAGFPEYLVVSANHGGRFMLAPFVNFTQAQRDELLKRAGIEPLPHRSRECKCINANKADLMRFTPEDIEEIKALEKEIGRPMYRPHRHLGAKGIEEVVKWAESERGEYRPPEYYEQWGSLSGCNTGFCE